MVEKNLVVDFYVIVHHVMGLIIVYFILMFGLIGVLL
jgi:hypothetical protein